MASGAWRFLDMVVRSFLSEVCATTERPYFENCKTAAQIWETLLTRHTCRGPMGQIEALRSFLSVELSADPKSWAAPLTTLRTPDPDSFRLTGLLIALSRNNSEFVHSLIAQPDLTLSSALRSVAALMAQPVPSGTGGFAFAASSASAGPRPPKKGWYGSVSEAQAKARDDKAANAARHIKHNAAGAAYTTLTHATSTRCYKK
ncbi:hypothetical protein R3P38DRAFT_3614293 [Favolaschia claudopus]|uniref:Uncharacterized protein n=1 Tax=Favolaschia claudopus TaxID=2862362 RepID=A0AAW0A4P9_9AGAR